MIAVRSRSAAPRYAAINLCLVLAMLGLIVLGPPGCATVKVRKVPTPSQYTHWTDQMQRQADDMEGLRFYLPRPFVAVHESFPVRTDVYLADGTISPDGKYVILTRIRGESEFARGNTLARGVSLPRRAVSDPKGGRGVRAEGKVEDAISATTQPSPNLPGDTPTEKPARKQDEPTSTAPAPPTGAKTGVTTAKATNSNGAFAYQPLRGNFDLAYLPDFDEQYAISARSGLGNANFEVNLGQGWSLQGFNSLTDNSELNKRIFDVIDTSISLAKKVAGASVDTLIKDLAAGASGAIRAEGAVQEERDPGTPVTLKFTVVHYAAKGLYPVIKPRELQDRIAKSSTGYCVLDLFKLFPVTTYASDVDNNALERSRLMVDNQTGNFTIPRYPYQYLSFNTFRYVAIETVRSDGGGFDTLYDATGTTGDRGDVTSADMLLKIIKELGLQQRSESADGPPKPPADPFLSDVQAIKFPDGATRPPFYFVSETPVLAGEKLTVTLDRNGVPPGATIEAVQKLFDDAVKPLAERRKVAAPKEVVIKYVKDDIKPPAAGKPAEAATKPVAMTKANADDAIKADIAKIKLPTSTPPYYKVDDWDGDGQKVTVTLAREGAAPPSETTQADVRKGVEAAFKKIAKDHNLTSPASVEVKYNPDSIKPQT